VNFRFGFSVDMLIKMLNIVAGQRYGFWITFPLPPGEKDFFNK